MKDLQNQLESEKAQRECQEKEINRLKSNVNEEELKINNFQTQIKQLNDELMAIKGDNEKNQFLLMEYFKKTKYEKWAGHKRIKR